MRHEFLLWEVPTSPGVICLIGRVLSCVAITLSAAVATANPAAADPDVFGVLSCGCEGAPAFPSRGTMREQIEAGIQQGLDDLLGDSG
ncbi:hypothetical protein ACX9NE_26600 [Mycobacterium sp. ML4]